MSFCLQFDDGALWSARCWVADARLLLVSSTASSEIRHKIAGPNDDCKT
jgi:hypothetical protein